MTFPFPPRGPIRIQAEISGPSGVVKASLLLDTGASSSLVSWKVLGVAGYDPAASTERVRSTAGTGTLIAPRLRINRLGALGRHAIGIGVVAHDLPEEAGVDGVLGLDFFRETRLTIDFRVGTIEVA